MPTGASAGSPPMSPTATVNGGGGATSRTDWTSEAYMQEIMSLKQKAFDGGKDPSLHQTSEGKKNNISAGGGNGGSKSSSGTPKRNGYGSSSSNSGTPKTGTGSQDMANLRKKISSLQEAHHFLTASSKVPEVIPEGHVGSSEDGHSTPPSKSAASTPSPKRGPDSLTSSSLQSPKPSLSKLQELRARAAALSPTPAGGDSHPSSLSTLSATVSANVTSDASAPSLSSDPPKSPPLLHRRKSTEDILREHINGVNDAQSEGELAVAHADGVLQRVEKMSEDSESGLEKETEKEKEKEGSKVKTVPANAQTAATITASSSSSASSAPSNQASAHHKRNSINHGKSPRSARRYRFVKSASVSARQRI